MSTEQSAPLQADEKPARPGGGERKGWGGWLAGAALAAFTLFFIANCRVALDPRVANPNVHGRPRPVTEVRRVTCVDLMGLASLS